MNEIVTAVTTISDMNAQIASAAEEQSAMTEEITININNISDATAHALGKSEDTASASADLQRLAQELEGVVRKFRI